MKKAKKCLALTLAFLLAVTVTACGSSSSSEPTGEAGTPVETEKLEMIQRKVHQLLQIQMDGRW